MSNDTPNEHRVSGTAPGQLNTQSSSDRFAQITIDDASLASPPDEVGTGADPGTPPKNNRGLRVFGNSDSGDSTLDTKCDVNRLDLHTVANYGEGSLRDRRICMESPSSHPIVIVDTYVGASSEDLQQEVVEHASRRAATRVPLSVVKIHPAAIARLMYKGGATMDDAVRKCHEELVQITNISKYMPVLIHISSRDGLLSAVASYVRNLIRDSALETLDIMPSVVVTNHIDTMRRFFDRPIARSKENLMLVPKELQNLTQTQRQKFDRHDIIQFNAKLSFFSDSSRERLSFFYFSFTCELTLGTGVCVTLQELRRFYPEVPEVIRKDSPQTQYKYFLGYNTSPACFAHGTDGSVLYTYSRKQSPKIVWFPFKYTQRLYSHFH